ncbi:hypothetical protein BCEN4_450012 [Burkholderia cenocepacia]|nr:hypothetical protein BCEN4_450012 [Burkholderia cenocepacia]
MRERAAAARLPEHAVPLPDLLVRWPAIPSSTRHEFDPDKARPFETSREGRRPRDRRQAESARATAPDLRDRRPRPAAAPPHDRRARAARHHARAIHGAVGARGARRIIECATGRALVDHAAIGERGDERDGRPRFRHARSRPVARPHHPADADRRRRGDAARMRSRAAAGRGTHARRHLGRRRRARAARARTVLAQPARLIASPFSRRGPARPALAASAPSAFARPRPDFPRAFSAFRSGFTPAFVSLAISGSLILNEVVRSRDAAHRIALETNDRNRHEQVRQPLADR